MIFMQECVILDELKAYALMEAHGAPFMVNTASASSVVGLLEAVVQHLNATLQQMFALLSFSSFGCKDL